jgi:hypothetical protein
MARLHTGSYQINFFDEYGEKHYKCAYDTMLTRAKIKARRYTKIAGLNSYQIVRAIYNSLDKDNRF